MKFRTGTSRLVALALGLSIAAAGPALAQTLVFQEKLTGVADQTLIDGLGFAEGDAQWNPVIPGGDLNVNSERFVRTMQSAGFQDNVLLTESSFPPFNSGGWVMRAIVRGVSTVSNSTGNHFALSVQGVGGAYGVQMLLNRTDGNHDFSFGTAPNYSDLFSAELFTLDQLPGRTMRLTFATDGQTLQAFVDDLEAAANPTNFHVVGMMPGTIGVTDWTSATVRMGSRFTGEADEIQLFNVVPYLETFSGVDVDPMPTSAQFDHPWSVADSNSPVQWAMNANRLVFKAAGATEDPHVFTEAPATMFGSDGWILESTISFGSALNLAANRVSFEVETTGGEVLGVTVRRTLRSGSRMFAYLGNESNVIGASASGSDLNPNTPHRVSLHYDAGELIARVANRELIVSAGTIGLGARNWRRVHVRGGADHGFSFDTVLFFEAGTVVPPTPTPAPSSTPAPTSTASPFPTASPTPAPTATPASSPTSTAAPCCPGDANNSGSFVDANDFIAVQANFGADNGVGGPGDANCSGSFVDANDFIAVQANFGADCG